MQDVVTGEAVLDGDDEYDFKITQGWGSFEYNTIAEESPSLNVPFARCVGAKERERPMRGGRPPRFGRRDRRLLGSAGG